MSKLNAMRFNFISRFKLARFKLARFKQILLVSLLALSLAVPMYAASFSQASATPSEAKKTTGAKVIKVSKSAKSSSKSAQAKNKRGTKVSSRNSKLRQMAKGSKRRGGNSAYLVPEESKHAALVIDATTGKVIFAKNATELRHPASLTKMMTLYLTFEALEKGRLKWDQMLPVSDDAAEQAPTNLSLKGGDTISVRDAVMGLVVRSANDAAVVLAEAIGGDEARFANTMTRKAQALGMTSTVFKNASGLPDDRQVTTARDLAVLALALRKHYPENYKLFSARSFSFNGRTYESHNRVMLRYAGADGLKTGYTRMSGFNLVTSASKYGYKLVGVVMGGVTGKSRDDEMITMLDNSFRKVASLSGKNIYASVDDMKEAADVHNDGEGDTDEVASTAAPAQVAGKNQSVEKGQPSTSLHSVQRAEASPKDTKNPDGQWGIQVGAYEVSKDALMAAANAKALAAEPLSKARIFITGTEDAANKMHRARLTNLTQQQAQDACKLLIQNRESCFVYRVETQYAQQL